MYEHTPDDNADVNITMGEEFVDLNPELSMQATFAHPVKVKELIGFLRGAPGYATVTIQTEKDGSGWAFTVEARWTE